MQRTAALKERMGDCPALDLAATTEVSFMPKYLEHYESWEQMQRSRGIDVEHVKVTLKRLAIETPSWGYGDSGTRFKVFQQEGVPRNPFEKLEDAAMVHRVTGAAPSVALHIPWDLVNDFSKLKEHADSLGIRIGAVNPNLFQEDDYKLGSLCHADPAVRRKAVDHMLQCIEIAKEVDSKIISLWLADGTNYPGQGDFRRRKHWLLESLHEVVEAMPDDMRLLIEYKFFEPAFYSTDIPDWGTAFLLATKLGKKAQVLIDTGHHPLATNIEQIVANLLDEAKLGGFHFNDRKYADDDVIVGTVQPYQLFLILKEMAAGLNDPATRKTAEDVAYMIDQSHNIEPKIPAMIRSVMNVQRYFAKALLVDLAAIEEAQAAGDVLAAEMLLQDAFETDVRPLLAKVRAELGLHPDPLHAYRESGYAEKILVRGTGGQSWSA